jgi:hypothetical protein
MAQMTAGELYDFCVSTDRYVKNVCSKYILGAVQGISLAAGKLGDKTTFCIPDDLAESRLAVFSFAWRAWTLPHTRKTKACPQYRLVGGVIIHAFPCGAR